MTAEEERRKTRKGERNEKENKKTKRKIVMRCFLDFPPNLFPRAISDFIKKSTAGHEYAYSY